MKRIKRAATKYCPLNSNDKWKKKDYLIPPSALVAVSFPGSISNILFQYSFDWL